MKNVLIIMLFFNNNNKILYDYIFIKIILFSGAKVAEVEQMVENHLETLIIKHFDPKKADSIFSAEGEVMEH